MDKTYLLANASIVKPEFKGVWAPGEVFEADELPDKGAYLLSEGHVVVTDKPAEPVPAAEDKPVDDAHEALLTENKGLKSKIGKLESHAKKVNAYAATLKGDAKSAFDAAMKDHKEEPKGDSKDA